MVQRESKYFKHVYYLKEEEKEKRAKTNILIFYIDMKHK